MTSRIDSFFDAWERVRSLTYEQSPSHYADLLRIVTAACDAGCHGAADLERLHALRRQIIEQIPRKPRPSDLSTVR